MLNNNIDYSPLSNEIGSKRVNSDKQGLEYIKKYSSITNENNYVGIEGFSNLFGENSVDKKNKTQVDELLKLQDQYQKQLSQYAKTYELLMSNVNNYFNMRKSPLLNKNIRLSDGKIGYVTNEGVFKQYPDMNIFNGTSGKNNCPSKWIQVEANIVDGKVTTTPPFIVGEPMQLGQSCGNEGKNVYAVNTGAPGKEVYTGCFNVPTSSSDLIYQDGLGETATFDSCKQLAHDSGSSVFALNGSTIDKLKCYIGKSIDSIRANGPALINKISWQTPPNVNAINAVFNNAGQLVIKGNISTTAETNLKQGLSFKVYNGYMNDDISYFRKASLISGGITNNFSSLASATKNISNANSTKISVEWLGYIKSNADCTINVSMTSDDCSFMWIGDNALSGYTKNNTFINNGGLHPEVTKTNTFSLKSTEYYPLRIQFGQNKGGNKFTLSITSNIQGGNIQFLTTPDPFTSNFIKPNQLITTLGDLWKSNNPIDGCDPLNGGKINNLVATWGYNCNSQNNPTGKSYDVKMGNYTDIINNLTGITKSVQIGKDLTDPAYLCKKDFSASFNCGKTQKKQIFIKGEAGGQTATFDCSEEEKKCDKYLYLNDDGSIVIKSHWDKNDNNIVWSSNTNTVGVENSRKQASKGKYRLNHLHPGQTLEDGEFIGSPTGKCFLTMIKGRGLILFYNKLACEETSGKNYGMINIPDSITAAAYVIPENDLSNFNKVGYIDRNSILKPYNNTLLTKSNSYTELGSFRLDGNSIKTINTTDLNVCKSECNNNSECDGFMFGNNACDLRNSANMFPSVKRYSDNTKVIYKRLNSVKNDASCSKNIVPVSVDLYSNYIQGTEMTINENCGLGVYNKEYYNKLNSDLRNLQSTVNKINSRLSKLSTTDKKILEQHGLTENKIKRDMLSISDTSNKYLNFKPEFETAKGMVVDSESEMLSNTYYSMLWSILAIMIVIGGIKMTK